MKVITVNVPILFSPVFKQWTASSNNHTITSEELWYYGAPGSPICTEEEWDTWTCLDAYVIHDSGFSIPQWARDNIRDHDNRMRKREDERKGVIKRRGR